MCWFWDKNSLFLIYTIFATLVCTETKSSARFSPHFQDGLSKKLLILRDFEEKERVKNCIYLLQLQQFIRANFCCIWFSGWGKYILQQEQLFNKWGAAEEMFRVYSNCQKMSQIICSPATWTIHWQQQLLAVVHLIFKLRGCTQLHSCTLGQHFFLMACWTTWFRIGNLSKKIDNFNLY